MTGSRHDTGIVSGALLRLSSRRAELMGMAAPVSYTAAQVRAWPADANRYEVVAGRLLVTPAPSLPHQRAVGALYSLLHSYLADTGVGEAFTSPADIELDERTLVQPDILVTPQRGLTAWSDISTLLLAIEVLSPSTAHNDRLVKRRLYQERGIECWIVDLDARIVEHWQPGDERPQIAADTLEWHPGGAMRPLIIDLAEFFAA